METKDDLSLPSDAVFSLGSLRSYIVCFNRAGEILKHSRSDQFESTHPFNRLSSTRTLKTFFDLPEGELPDNMDGSRAVSSKPGYYVLEDYGYFYTSMPVLGLKFRRIGPDRFLGAVIATEIIPNFHTGASGCFFFTDPPGNLVGFNHSFYRYFSGRYREPRLMLDRPLRELLDPTPSDIQKRHLARLSLSKMKEFSVCTEADFRSLEELPASLALTGGSVFKKGEGGWIWENRTPEMDFLQYRPEWDLTQKDFLVILESEVMEGTGPVLEFFEGPPGRHLFPDAAYFIGSHADPELAVIRRAGFLLQAGKTGRHGPGTGMAVDWFCKLGRSWLWYRDGKKVVGYLDLDGSLTAKGTLYLGLRKGCACRVRRLSVLSRQVREPGQEEPFDRSVVALRTPREESFLISRYFNISLSSSLHEIQGFFLQNVSQLNGQISQLALKFDHERKRGRTLENLLKSYRTEQDTFIGSSPQTLRIKEQAMIAAGTDATVLIQGPTGTGKEMLANYIHVHSPYRDGPFIKVDCSLLPRELMESELFGHEKGAFTGSTGRKTGRFEMANRGTLFLDEIGNIPLDIQAKLLQFLQDFTVTRVGGVNPVPLTLRVIAATNMPLEALVRSGAFRQDLYYRLCVVTISIEPLARRKEDLADLCGYFLKTCSDAYKKPVQGFSPAALRRLHAHGWPGNVRELRNVIQRAVLFCEKTQITEDLIAFPDSAAPLSAAAARPAGAGEAASRRQILAGMSDGEFLDFMKRHQDHVAGAAAALGVSRRAVYFRLGRIKSGKDR